MPSKARAPRKTTAAKTEKSASTSVGGDAALIAREQEAAERSRVAASGIYLTPIDEEGKPTGPPRHMGGPATVQFTPDDSGIELPSLAPGATIEFSTDDPDAVAMVRELTRIPIPTAVINQWWPAFVRVPDDDTVWNLCKVFLAPQGLYVYRAAPSEPETFTSGAMPTWYSSVNFEETTKPVSGYAARNAGIPIVTAAGTVTVQPTTGCGCQARGLKGWRPSWLRNVISWADGVKLAAGSTDGR